MIAIGTKVRFSPIDDNIVKGDFPHDGETGTVDSLYEGSTWPFWVKFSDETICPCAEAELTFIK